MPKIIKQIFYWSGQVIDMTLEFVRYLYEIALMFWFLTIMLIFLLIAWRYGLLQ